MAAVPLSASPQLPGGSSMPKKAAEKVVRDDVSELKEMRRDLEKKVEEATQSIEKVKLDFSQLTEQNLKFLKGIDPPKANYLLTDNDGKILRTTMDIKMEWKQLQKFLRNIMILLDVISHKYDAVYRKLETIDEHIKSHEIDPTEFSQELARVEDSCIKCFGSLKPDKKDFMDLQTKITNYFQQEISSWDNALKDPLIITITPTRLKALWSYLSGQVDLDTKTIHTRDFAEKVHQIFEIYQLKRIVAKEPLADVVVIECWKQIRFAFWKIKKEAMKIKVNLWKEHFGDVMDQLDHEICWAIVSSELVSVIRNIKRLDIPRINYSPQYLVDFTRPVLRSSKRHGGHFCYTCPVKEALNLVKKCGIEKEEARPFKRRCKANVPPKNYSNLGYIKDVVSPDTLEKTLEVLPRHPVAASIPIFEPEYSAMKNGIYRGPTSRISRYVSMHAVNITGSGEENGEKFIWVRSSHGLKIGVSGYFKVSAEVMMMCLTRGKYEHFIEHPFPLITQFVYPIVYNTKAEEEKRRMEENQARRREEVRRDN